MINIKNIKYEIGGKFLYNDLNLLLGNDEKVGLIGRNGCGKTTLFKIILGNIEPDAGQVLTDGERIGYLPQLINFTGYHLVGEFIESLVSEQWETYKAIQILDELHYNNYDEYQQVSTLSEGQKMKLKLCELLLKEPTLLLLDEPTNHLDLTGIQLFENFIKKFDGIIIMISHDRTFLNNTVNKIVEIDRGVCRVYEGDYDDFKIGKENWIQRTEMDHRVYLKKKDRIERLIENVRKIKNGKKRGNAVRAAKKRYDREIVQKEIIRYSEKSIKQFSLDGEVHNNKLVVQCTNLSKSFSGNTVFNNFNLEIRGQTRLWLYGDNGTGKSTLVKILMNELNQSGGDVKWGTNIRVGYYAQVQDNAINNINMLDYFIEQTHTTREKAFSSLLKFLFTKDDFRKNIGILSPGERARLLFSIFVQNEYELLILDEPTNHLDIQTKELMEEALREYKGAVLLISHDRYFIEEVGMDDVIVMGM